MLSIDIGKKNLGYTYFELDEGNNLVNIESGIFNIDEKLKKNSDVVTYRCSRIKDFFKKFTKEIKYVVIERQVNKNVIAMNLMYGISSYAQMMTEDVFIFDPKMKFTTIGIEYCTKDKAHKKLSIDIAKKLITKMFPEKLPMIESHDKQDDIADSFNQGLIYGITKKVFSNYKDIKIIRDML